MQIFTTALRRLEDTVGHAVKAMQDSLDSEFCHRARDKSDLDMKLGTVGEQVKCVDSAVKSLGEGLSNVAGMIPYLVEDSYIQSLLDMAGPEEEIKYRDRSYSRVDLIKLRSKLLNENWNAATLKEPWKSTAKTQPQARSGTSTADGRKRSAREYTSTRTSQQSFAKRGHRLILRNTRADLSSSARDLQAKRSTIAYDDSVAKLEKSTLNVLGSVHLRKPHEKKKARLSSSIAY